MMRDDIAMRTTLDIDQDVLLAAKRMSTEKGMSMGRVLSELARKSLAGKGRETTRNGVPLFPNRQSAGVASMELVNRLRDESA